MKAAKLPSGTLYPMLARLQQDGLVDSEWEAQRRTRAAGYLLPPGPALSPVSGGGGGI